MKDDSTMGLVTDDLQFYALYGTYSSKPYTGLKVLRPTWDLQFYAPLRDILVTSARITMGDVDPLHWFKKNHPPRG